MPRIPEFLVRRILGSWKAVSGFLGSSRQPDSALVPVSPIREWTHLESKNCCLVFVQNQQVASWLEAVLYDMKVSFATCKNADLAKQLTVAPTVAIVDEHGLGEIPMFKERWPEMKTLLVTFSWRTLDAELLKKMEVDGHVVLPLSRSLLARTLGQVTEEPVQSAKRAQAVEKTKQESFLDNAEQLEAQFLKSGLNRKTFAAAHGMSASQLDNELRLSGMEPRTKILIREHGDLFRKGKSLFVAATAQVDGSQIYALCLELVDRATSGKVCDLKFLKQRLAELKPVSIHPLQHAPARADASDHADKTAPEPKATDQAPAKRERLKEAETKPTLRIAKSAKRNKGV